MTMPGRTSVEHLLEAANAAAAHARTTWLSFLLVGTYLLITVGATSHVDLLLVTPARLPLLDVDVDLVTFFWVAPLMLLIFYVYTLVAHVILAGRFEALNTALAADRPAREDHELFRQRVHPYLVAQSLAGPRYARLPSRAMDLILQITLVAYPVIVLLAFQIRFLPFHDELMTWGHRAFVLAAVMLTLMFWPLIRRPMKASRSSRHEARRTRFTRAMIGGIVAAPVLFFSFGVATLPEERIESWLAGTGMSVYVRGRPVFWPTAMLFDGRIDPVRRSPVSLMSRNLVIIRADLVAMRPELKLRGRDLSYAILTESRLAGADLYGVALVGADLRSADLAGATLDGADLRFAHLGRTNLTGATMMRAQLSVTAMGGTLLVGARLDGADLERAYLAGAQMQGAWLDAARLTRANLTGAQLQGARLEFASLRNATLSRAVLVAATLAGADLEGAALDGSNLVGATLAGARLQNARLDGAQLQGATIRRAQIWGTTMTNASTDLLDHRELREIVGSSQDVDDEWSERHGWHQLATGASDDDYDEQIVAFLADLACSTFDPPFVAAGIARRVVSPRAAWQVVPTLDEYYPPLMRLETAPPIGDDPSVRRGVALRLLADDCLGAAVLDADARDALRRLDAALRTPP